MPWIHIPKNGDIHSCNTPMGWFKPLGSKWECPICGAVYIKTADMHGSYMDKEDRWTS